MRKLVRTCPQCGNHVVGEYEQTLMRKATRGVFQKGSCTLTGAIVGSVVPGPGNAIGAGVGIVGDILVNAVMSDTINRIADNTSDYLLGIPDVKYACPKCGLNWTVPSNEVQKDYVSNIGNLDTETNSFSRIWNDYFEQKSEIFSDRNQIKNYVEHINNCYA